jgi:hypothetical protein
MCGFFDVRICKCTDGWNLIFGCADFSTQCSSPREGQGCVSEAFSGASIHRQRNVVHFSRVVEGVLTKRLVITRI